MPFIRRRGNQLVLAHGEREPGTGKVQQRILFTLYSRPEALAAIGRGSPDARHQFRYFLQDAYPKLSFDWKAIDRAIARHLDTLPDSYEYKSTRLLSRFRADLCAFARQLIVTDPYGLASASQVLDEHRRELQFLGELIQQRLRTKPAEANPYNQDNPWLWRAAFRGREVPAAVEERGAEHLDRNELEQAETIFRLLVDSFEDYAEGYNYLGLIAYRRSRIDDAVAHFRKTVEVGRRLIPKRVAKSSWWTDISTRPYMRGLRNLALALNEAGAFAEALEICRRLEVECDDAISANAHRASICMNTSRWADAAKAALHNRNLDPTESLVAGLAQFELGRLEDAVVSFLHGALNSPRAAQMLVGRRTKRPEHSHEGRDHNAGVHLLRTLQTYLSARRRPALLFLSSLLDEPRVEALVMLQQESALRWHSAGRDGNRADFERMTEMQTLAYAERQAKDLSPADIRAGSRRLH